MMYVIKFAMGRTDDIIFKFGSFRGPTATEKIHKT